MKDNIKHYWQRLSADFTDRVDSLSHDKEVIKEQWRDYQKELELYVRPGIREASWSRPLHKLHKYAAYVEEFVDKQPRIVYLSLFIIVPLAVYGVVELVR